MSTRGRSTSPHPLHDEDVDMENGNGGGKPHAKVVIVTNLTRNVVEAHLRTIFSFYGDVTKIDLPVFGKSGQNRGKAAIEYVDAASAHRAASHMDGGQLDGAILKVELSELPLPGQAIRTSRSTSPRYISPPLAHALSLAHPQSRTPAPEKTITQLRARWHGVPSWAHSLAQLLRAVKPFPHEIPYTPVQVTLWVLFVIFAILPKQDPFSDAQPSEAELEPRRYQGQQVSFSEGLIFALTDYLFGMCANIQTI
ncbi:hypothetical protein DAEQUDRAFT_807449 [Daedalea quercina L-15889]|uniref:RRM domain-containing protein n=1 Tax=Daedalea quercina L-15889 TaxID=1314783 RepID=A0A165U2B9_9APHY|nr:hypothetical protein DAEQUDRAFT_807449 [Daedalea quercina L-15889]